MQHSTDYVAADTRAIQGTFPAAKLLLRTYCSSVQPTINSVSRVASPCVLQEQQQQLQVGRELLVRQRLAPLLQRLNRGICKSDKIACV